MSWDNWEKAKNNLEKYIANMEFILEFLEEISVLNFHDKLTIRPDDNGEGIEVFCDDLHQAKKIYQIFTKRRNVHIEALWSGTLGIKITQNPDIQLIVDKYLDETEKVFETLLPYQQTMENFWRVFVGEEISD